jgi:hypothetical protein
MPVTRTAFETRVPPVSRTTEPVFACSSCAVVGASTISSGPAGIRPAVSTTAGRLPLTGA